MLRTSLATSVSSVRRSPSPMKSAGKLRVTLLALPNSDFLAGHDGSTSARTPPQRLPAHQGCFR